MATTRVALTLRTALLDGGRTQYNSGYLRIYTGAMPATPETAASGTLLAELRLNATAFPAAASGVLTANAVTSDTSADAPGTPGWFRILKSDGTTALTDGDVGASGVLGLPVIAAGTVVALSSLTLTLPMESAAAPVGRFVAPSGGVASGAGSIDAPWTIAYAAGGAGGTIQPGETVWLRGGTYSMGAQTWSLHGSNGNPVTVRSYPGEWAKINGTFTINGADVNYWGFEQYINAHTHDVMGFNVTAARVKLINLVIHENSGNGIGTWIDAPDCEVTGCILYNNAYWGQDGTWPVAESWGHGIYSQNQAPATKWFRQNILFQQFGYGYHLYSESDHVENYTVEENIGFQNSMRNGAEFLIHSGVFAPTGIICRNNWFSRPTGIGIVAFDGNASTTITISGNRVIGGYCVRLTGWTTGSCTVQNNVVEVTSGYYSIDGDADATPSCFTWSGNTWYGAAGSDEIRWGGNTWTWAGWKTQTGLGTGESYNARPSPAVTRLQVNPYESTRGHLAIYNPSSASTVAVDISPVVVSGHGYAIYHVYDLSTPVLSGTYAGGTVNVPMGTGTATPPAPYNGGLGWDTIPSQQALPKFGAFVVKDTG